MMYRLLAALVALLLACPPAPAQPAGPPLKPPDRSSPVATIRTFLESLDAIAQHVAGRYMSAPGRSDYKKLRELAQTPIECLDLEHIPPASRAKVGTAAAIHLYEVLARLDLAALDAPAVPGAAPETWTLPDTPIRVVRNRHGDYVFSAETVAQSKAYFDRIRHLPYTRHMPLPDICRLPVEGGGWLIPYSLVLRMPPILQLPLLEQAAWKWIALALLILAFLLVMRGAFLFSRVPADGHPVREAIRRLSLPAVLLAITPAAGYFAMVQINLFGDVAAAVMFLTTFLLFSSLAWLSWRAAPVVAETIIASPRIPDDSIDAHLIRIVARLLGLAASACFLAMGADRLGVPVYGVVAGLGVGGLALALAAQPTIENLIGGLSLFADKPMKVGDLGTYGDVSGTVEAIGIRSTRIRGADRSVTSVPNATLSKATIINLSRRDRMLFKSVLPLRHETSPGQLRFLLARLRDLLEGHAAVDPATVRVRLTAFSESSLDVELLAYVKTTDNAEFYAIRENLLLATMDLVAEAGTRIAIPAMLEYTASDPGLDADKGRAAEAAIPAITAPGPR